MTSPLPYNRKNATASGIAADNAKSIAGKIVITTGVTLGGLGAAFVQEVAKHNPKLLVLAGRDISKLEATAAKIKEDPKAAGVETRILALDLSSQAQIRDAAREVINYPEDHIDVLVNSAGIMGGPHRTTKDGIELQFGSNHIGHFLFTNLIMPKLLAAKAPRVVSIASDGHRISGIRFDDSNFQDGKVYDQWQAYGQSKSANILFATELVKKVGPKGLRAYSLHPGQALGTSLAPHGITDEDLKEIADNDKKIGWVRDSFDFKTIDECAATHVVAAFDPRLDDLNGAFLEDGNLAPHMVMPTASNPEHATKLWALSEKLVGQKFDY